MRRGFVNRRPELVLLVFFALVLVVLLAYFRGVDVGQRLGIRYVTCTLEASELLRCPPVDGQVVLARWGEEWAAARFVPRRGLWVRIGPRGDRETPVPPDEWMELHRGAVQG